MHDIIVPTILEPIKIIPQYEINIPASNIIVVNAHNEICSKESLVAYRNMIKHGVNTEIVKDDQLPVSGTNEYIKYVFNSFKGNLIYLRYIIEYIIDNEIQIPYPKEYEEIVLASHSHYVYTWLLSHSNATPAMIRKYLKKRQYDLAIRGANKDYTIYFMLHYIEVFMSKTKNKDAFDLVNIHLKKVKELLIDGEQCKEEHTHGVKRCKTCIGGLVPKGEGYGV